MNCSEVSQGMLRILTVLESCLAASFVKKSKPTVDLRNLVLHVLRTLSAVPSSWRPNDVLRQIVVHLDRNDAPGSTILETAVDRAPPYEELAGITFQFLLVFCGQRRLAGSNAEGVRTNFIAASWTF